MSRSRGKRDELSVVPPPSAAAKNESAQKRRALQMGMTLERTLLAWVRSGISLTVCGFVVARFDLLVGALNGGARVSAALSIEGALAGLLLVGMGLLCNLHAVWRFVEFHRRVTRKGRVPAIPVVPVTLAVTGAMASSFLMLYFIRSMLT